jgi:hypothetical protein
MPKIEIPDWVEDTPADPSYSLAVFDNEGNMPQEIDVTRDEYIALKRHLAAMRGYFVTDIPAQVAALCNDAPEVYRQKDEQQIARHLETARDFYRACPDLVVFDSDELADYVKKLTE